MREIGKRSVLILLVVIGYFVLVRPVRGVVNEYIYNPLAEYVVEQQPLLSMDSESSSVSNEIWVNADLGIEKLYFTVSFGLHFMLACMGLVAIKAQRKYFGYVVLIQLATGLLSIVFLVLSNSISIQFISLADFTLRYLNPLSTLGLVPLAFTLQKRRVNEQKA